MTDDLTAINAKLDTILAFLDIQAHRLTTENSSYSPDTLQKLVSDTVLSVLRDGFQHWPSFDSSRDYMLDVIAQHGARMFRSDYIPRKYGFMDYDSRYDLFRFALSECLPEPGLHLEFGVYRGGSMAFMSRYTQDPIYGFDSFEGLPENWFTGSQKGRFDVGGQLPITDADNLHYVKGWFDETLPAFLQAHREDRIKFIHFDCDLYRSHRDVFDALLAAQVDLNGTIALFDEYLNFPRWEQDAHRALQEFVADSPWTYRYVGFTTRYTAVAVRFERAA